MPETKLSYEEKSEKLSLSIQLMITKLALENNTADSEEIDKAIEELKRECETVTSYGLGLAPSGISLSLYGAYCQKVSNLVQFLKKQQLPKVSADNEDRRAFIEQLIALIDEVHQAENDFDPHRSFVIE